jgi:hypothetical protein
VRAWDLAARLYGDLFADATATWLLSKSLSWLTHLEALGEAVREPSGDGEAWRPA